MARKTVHCVVGTKKGRPFAVLVARGDDPTSRLDVVQVPDADASADEHGLVSAAMVHALRALGLDPSRLAAEGFEEPVMVLDELGEETTFEDLQQTWAMTLMAPSKT